MEENRLIWPQVRVLEHGINIFESPQKDSFFLSEIFDFTGKSSEDYNLVTINDRTVYIPVIVNLQPLTENTRFSTSEYLESREELEKKLSGDMGAGSSFGEASGEFDFLFRGMASHSEHVAYSVIEEHVHVAKVDLHFDQMDMKWFSRGFTEMASGLPDPYDSKVRDHRQKYSDLFSRFGMYGTKSIRIGGKLFLCTSNKNAAALSSAKIQLFLKAEYDAMMASGTIDLSVEDIVLFSEFVAQKKSLVTSVGNFGDQPSPGSLNTLDDMKEHQEIPAQVNKWVRGLRDDWDKTSAAVDWEVQPITDILARFGKNKDDVENATKDFLAWTRIPFHARVNTVTVEVGYNGGEIIKPTEHPIHADKKAAMVLFSRDEASLRANSPAVFYIDEQVNNRQSGYLVLRNISNRLGQYAEAMLNILIVTPALKLEAGRKVPETLIDQFRTCGADKGSLTDWVDALESGKAMQLVFFGGFRGSGETIFIFNEFLEGQTILHIDGFFARKSIREEFWPVAT